ncbi:MAG TPA: hypothetical protein VFO85_03050, partial [Vicinamibacteria bacterium]|nr:hypothetical protein [Vicinamibacteria bacterium]
ATHPPLPDRIRRLEPQWSGELPQLDEEGTRAAVESTLAEKEKPRGLPGLPGMPALPGPGGIVGATAAVLATTAASPTPRPAPPRPAAGPAPVPAPAPTAAAAPAAPLDAIAARSVVDSVGRLDAEHIGYAERLLAALPPRLREDVREPMGAAAAVFALLLDRDAALRVRQMEELSRSVDLTLYSETARVAPLVDACAVESRLPLVDLALPALRRLSEPQYRRFAAAVGRLMAADARLTLFEFTLQRVLLRHLESHFRQQAPPAAVHGSVAAVARPAGVLLSALAHAGQRADAATAAFEAARRALGGDGTVTLCAPPQCGVDAVDRALTALAQATPPVKQQVLEACVTAVAHDRRITVREGELLRAVADSLDCPLPPFVPGQAV